MLEKSKLTDMQKDYLDNIKTSTNILLHIINDILDFTKVEAGKIEKLTIAFRKLIYDCISIYISTVNEKGIIIKTQIDKKIPDALITDPLRLSQIINNLISNAIKFTENGEILIKVTNDSVEAQIITLRFDIVDTGIGIDNKLQEKLFKPFSQVDESTTRKFGGTGLGLSIVSQLVNLMGGEIGVESNVRVGSNFYFTLKLEILNDNIRIRNFAKDIELLIISENQTQSSYMKDHFEMNDANVQIRSSIESFIKEFLINKNQYENVKGIMLDCRILGENSLRFAVALKFLELAKDVKLIMYNNDGNETFIKKANEYGVDCVLNNNSNIEEILLAIEQLY